MQDRNADFHHERCCSQIQAVEFVPNRPRLKRKLLHFHFPSVFTNALVRLRDSGLEENLRKRWINGHIAGIGEDMAGENGSLKGGQLILGFALMLVSYMISLGVLCTEKYWKWSIGA